ncbi:MAG: glycosyltransferase family 4 protein [Candidatus Omnitrophica bacterium]|nr:glycosyltransferase family 4 protein [Candidatus Omnitrophota bacterium]
MNIWLIQVAEPLPITTGARKMRTAFLTDKLTDRGHNVLWWASAFSHLEKKWIFRKDTELNVKENLTIKTLKGVGYRKNISMSRFVDLRIIAKKFKRSAPKMPKPDIIITSMPPHNIAFEVVMFAKKNNIPVLVDIRDEWPDLFLNHVPKKLQIFAKIALSREFFMIKKTMQMADGLIAANNPFFEWGLNYAKRNKTWRDRVFYLGCKENHNPDNKSDRIFGLINDLSEKFVVLFMGTFGYYHNPSVLIKCASKLIGSDVRFVLAGAGEFFEEIKNKASSLPNVKLPGWLNQNEITTLLQHCHVGVCPTTHITDLFPNKVFTYLSAGLPVISAFQGELKDIIKKEQIGFYFPPDDADTLSRCIEELHKNSVLYEKMSKNAVKIFTERFDANMIYEDYSKHIENIANMSNNSINIKYGNEK